MTRRKLRADLVVIGAGSGGLSVASGAAQLGLKVVLFEKGEMGGDCLNYGCVPSKALIAAAAAAHQARHSRELGVSCEAVHVDFPKVMACVRSVIAGIAPNDSQARFEALGVEVIRDAAYFLDPNTVATDDVQVSARKVVIATGSRAIVPPVPGLVETPFLTNETVFDLEGLPQKLIILGGGPIGIELGQAFRRLGSQVVIVDSGAMLAREDEAAAEVVLTQLSTEGVELFPMHKVMRVEPGPHVVVRGPAGEQTISGSHLLVAVGREASIASLEPDKGRIEQSSRGVKTDASLRTTNRRVHAVGDVAGRGQFTHLAGAQAALMIRRLVFGLPANADALVVPRVTYSDPELATVGLSESEARRLHGETVRVERIGFAENDRAQAEDDTRGFAKLITTRKGKILGVVVVGRHAGELIHTWVLAMSSGIKLSQIAGTIAPYPTRSEITKRIAGKWFVPALFAKRTQLVASILKRFA